MKPAVRTCGVSALRAVGKRRRRPAASFCIDAATDCGETREQALAPPGAAVIEAMIDPLEPPMPAKVQPEQALKITEALVRGEPSREKIIATVVSDKVRELV